MDKLMAILEATGQGSLYAAVLALCLAGMAVSCLSFSGTWLVLAGGLLVRFATPQVFPGWITITFMLLICIGVEMLEALASGWGVKRKGGSSMAGVLALLGGIVGLFAGGLFPVPIVGSLIGMMVFSFVPAFAWELHRLRSGRAAAGIAIGAVTARLMILLFKMGVTSVMIVWLGIGLWLTWR